MAELSVAEQVENALDEKRSFLVEAGAGSGKTHTLVHGLRHLLSQHRSELQRRGKSIACITYTNVARRQIIERIADDPLVHVSTIHEFLWSVIGDFQQPLKAEILVYNTELKKPEELTGWPTQDRITYSDRGRRLAEGRISHDDVLRLALRLATRHPKLIQIIADRYPYILVDEYQDTARETVGLLLDHLAEAGRDRCVVGLFGDSMQQIYQHGVGAVAHPKLTVIPKHENYRSAPLIVDVLNQMRPELPQQAVRIQEGGEVHLFLPRPGLTGPERLKAAQETLRALEWSEPDTKYLMLTHRGIAGTLEYPGLLRLFTKLSGFARDRFLDGTDFFAQYMLQIEALCQAYEAKNYVDLSFLLGKGAMKVTQHSRKAEIAQHMGEILNLRLSGTIGEVFDQVHRRGLIVKPKALRSMERMIATTDLDEKSQRKADFARDLRALSYAEAMAYTKFFNEATPFATQHGVKGDEFENVVVVIDDEAWNQYKVGNMLAGRDIEARLRRSRNLFYVCCSRAEQRLAVVFMTELPMEAEAVARKWFASGTVHD
ncbi:UvrD-helicase domain-containing protein [Streptosporangium saharense]|uniref:UvrD-helicase domain-containing protein n=1 Tax=Streptosporangium saharense TaxID=1706840 RepID=UPI00368F6C54